MFAGKICSSFSFFEAEEEYESLYFCKFSGMWEGFGAILLHEINNWNIINFCDEMPFHGGDSISPRGKTFLESGGGQHCFL